MKYYEALKRLREGDTVKIGEALVKLRHGSYPNTKYLAAVNTSNRRTYEQYGLNRETFIMLIDKRIINIKGDFPELPTEYIPRVVKILFDLAKGVKHESL